MAGVCARSRERAPFGQTLPGARRVPPSRFRTASTASITLRFAGLLHPAAGQGFVAFQGLRSRSRPKTVADLRAPSPRRGFTPSEEFPSSAAGTASLRPVAFLTFRTCPHRHDRGRGAGSRASRESRGSTGRNRGSSLTQVVVPSSGDAPVPPGEPGRTPTSPRLYAPPANRRNEEHGPAARGPAEAEPHQPIDPVRGGIARTARGGGLHEPTPGGADREPSTGRNRGPLPTRPHRRTDPRADRHGPSGPFVNDASGRLQGLAPPTSPLCPMAVAGHLTPDPSMGFVPLQGVLPAAAAARPNAGSGTERRAEARAGRRLAVSTEADDGGGSLCPSLLRFPTSTEPHGPPRGVERPTPKGGDTVGSCGPRGRSRPRAPRLFSGASAAWVRAPRPPDGRSRRGAWSRVAGVCPETDWVSQGSAPPRHFEPRDRSRVAEAARPRGRAHQPS
jgi:hypothetical protein